MSETRGIMWNRARSFGCRKVLAGLILSLVGLGQSAIAQTGQVNDPNAAATTAQNNAQASVPQSATDPNAQTPLSPRQAERMLSAYYEEISRAALQDIIPSDKYKLLIDVRLEDESELSEVRRGGYTPLPGTFRNRPEFNQEFLLGELELLSQSRSILLILDPEYEENLGPDAGLKELLQETLMGKLKLNLAAGSDQINVRNLNMSGDKAQPSRMPASVVEEAPVNWVEYAASLAGLLIVIFALFFLLRRKKASDADVPEQASIDVVSRNRVIRAEQKEVEEDSEEEAAPQKEMVSEDAPVLPSLVVLPDSPNSDNLLKAVRQIVDQYPKLTSVALQDYIDEFPDKLYRVSFFVELLGFEESLKLFKGVSQKHWRIIGQYMADYPISNETPIDLGEAAALYRYLVARIVEHKGLESEMGVFVNEGYSATDLARAIDGESDQFVAQFISGVSDAMAQDILNSLPGERRLNILTLLSAIDSLDSETIRSIEATIKERLSEDGVKPISIANESRIFSSLANLSAHEEEQLFAQMVDSDPAIIERSKRFRLYPEHFEQIKQEILEEEFRAYPIEAIANVLKGMSANLRPYVFSALTEKKALVVEDMLNSLEQAPNGPEYAEARRSLLDEIFHKYASGGSEFIDSIFKRGSGSEESGNAA